MAVDSKKFSQPDLLCLPSGGWGPGGWCGSRGWENRLSPVYGDRKCLNVNVESFTKWIVLHPKLLVFLLDLTGLSDIF